MTFPHFTQTQAPENNNSEKEPKYRTPEENAGKTITDAVSLKKGLWLIVTFIQFE